MVRIALKITFLKLRYPKGVTGRVFLSPIMALEAENSKKKKKTWLKMKGNTRNKELGMERNRATLHRGCNWGSIEWLNKFDKKFFYNCFSWPSVTLSVKQNLLWNSLGDLFSHSLECLSSLACYRWFDTFELNHFQTSPLQREA